MKSRKDKRVKKLEVQKKPTTRAFGFALKAPKLSFLLFWMQTEV